MLLLPISPIPFLYEEMSQDQLIEQVLEEMWRCVQFNVHGNVEQLCLTNFKDRCLGIP